MHVVPYSRVESAVDGEKVTDISTSYMLDEFAGEGKVVKRGKKKFAKVISK